MQLTTEQCEARMLSYTREFYQTDKPLMYLDDDVWPLCAFIVRRTAEDVARLYDATAVRVQPAPRRAESRLELHIGQKVAR
jgi:hypothetical protein